MKKNLPTSNEILIITSYPTRECGIATFSKDLTHAMQESLSDTFKVKICALEKDAASNSYPENVKFILNTSKHCDYIQLAHKINKDENIKTVFIQHEFGLYGGEYGEFLMSLLYSLEKPVVVTFHTVLPHPNNKRRDIVNRITQIAERVIVMTENSADILREFYTIAEKKIQIIPHGTHPIEHKDKEDLRKKYGFENKKIVSTFGLISSNKNIENALDALPSVINLHPDLLYLIIGKTHPEVIKNEGEKYRKMLEHKVKVLKIHDNVRFINRYTELDELLDLLQMTDTYIFTSKDKNQAVSGTFAYAMSCGCPVVATAIPHAKELLSNNAGILIDFEKPEQLSNALLTLLGDKKLREHMSSNAIHKSKSSEWKNIAIQHALIFNSNFSERSLSHNLPEISLKHIEKLTHHFGIVQFSKINTPDPSSGYTLDDNARALIAVCMHYELTKEAKNFLLIDKYLRFIGHCQKKNGQFFNYMDEEGKEHDQNSHVNLEDSNGRAILALGTVISYKKILPVNFVVRAAMLLRLAIPKINVLKSPRAIAFSIKGLYFFNLSQHNRQINDLIFSLANNLSEKYYTVKDGEWKWFEDSLTYGNSILPESLLYAHLSNRNGHFKAIAKATFDFLLSHTFTEEKMQVISNNGWLKKGEARNMNGGEQPIDVAYTIQSLQLFYAVFKEEQYRDKMETAFSWFLGNNNLNQMLYNPTTAGCHDGLEKTNVNLNQGAESTICYLIARLCIEKSKKNIPIIPEIPISRKSIMDLIPQGRLTITQ